MSDEPTVPPKKPPPPTRTDGDGDADRTIIAPATPGAGAPPEPAEGGEDTWFMPNPAVPQPEAPHPGTAPQPEADPDRTIIAGAEAPSPPTSPTPAGPDPDATIIVQPTTAAPEAGDPDATIIATQTPAARPPSGGPELSEPQRILQPGTIINNAYRVEHALDHGGMGRVFRGEEISTGEPVAIKVILPEMADDEKVAQMFKREARTLRQLHHDAIVRYFAYVPPDAQLNLHALVMGYIEGTKLSDRLKSKGGLRTKEFCRLFERLAEGLARAHEIGVIHRDLSPDNVMLPEDDLDKAVLIDFGISRSAKVKDVTLGNEFAGKLKYVSPEQLGAYGGEAGPASDVYSMGLLMMAALSGQAPPMGDSITDAVQKRQDLPDLSGLPFVFQPMLAQMLQPDPAHRMKTMAEVLEQLRDISGGRASDRTLTTGPFHIVPGLQTVPSATIGPRTLPGQGGTLAPGTTPPGETLTERAREVSDGGGKGWIWILLLLALLAGGGGYYAWTSGLLGGPEAASSEESPDPVAEGLVRVEGAQGTFLAEATEETCAYATLRSQGENTGLIEAFGDAVGQSADLSAGWESRFGTRPAVVAREVTAAQCAVLELARAFQGTQGAPIEVALDLQAMAMGEAAAGAVHGAAGREVWLALVAPDGSVFSLTSQLQAPIGERRGFSFLLRGGEPGVYLVLALTSERALARVGALRGGEPAPELMELLLRELARDGQGAVDLGALDLSR